MPRKKEVSLKNKDLKPTTKLQLENSSEEPVVDQRVIKEDCSLKREDLFSLVNSLVTLIDTVYFTRVSCERSYDKEYCLKNCQHSKYCKERDAIKKVLKSES